MSTLKRIILEIKRLKEEMKTVIKQSNCIANVCYQLAERGREEMC